MSTYTARTPEAREVIVAAIAAGMPRFEAAKLAGMSRATLHRWTQDDETLRDEITRAEGRAILQNLNVIRVAAQGRAAEYDANGRVTKEEVKPDWRAAAWWLVRASEYFRERLTIDVQSAVREVAAENGLDEDEVMAEVEALLQKAS